MSEPQGSTPFDPNKHVPAISEAEARQIEAELYAGTAIRKQTPEEIAAYKEEQRRFGAEILEMRERAERAEREKREAKEMGMRLFQENLAAGEAKRRAAESAQREKQITELNDCAIEIYRLLTKLNNGLKKFSVEEIDALPGLKPGLQSLLSKIP